MLLGRAEKQITEASGMLDRYSNNTVRLLSFGEADLVGLLGKAERQMTEASGTLASIIKHSCF
ncbi:MAG: hypothetical protein HFE78_02630 [Clostridiales bacterium]|nr:hypothetical protein [Clostridiales bacterium]